VVVVVVVVVVVKVTVHRADNFTTLLCQLSSNLGTSASWNQACIGIALPFVCCVQRVILFLT